MIADYMFNKFSVPAGYRLCVVLSSGPMSSGALGNLTGKTVADLRALGSTLATAVPTSDVGAFGFRIERSQTSAYGQKYVPAFSVPSQCVYSQVKSGNVSYVILALLDGSTAAAKIVRCYQCSAGLSGAEAKLSRITVSGEDKSFTAKLELTGIPGQQIGNMERNLRPAPMTSAVAMVEGAERTLNTSAVTLSAVRISDATTETVQPNTQVLV